MKKLNRNTYLSICLLLLLSLIFSSTTIAQLHPRGYSSPEVHSDKTVTFNFRAPRASEVKLNTQCLSEEVVMQKGDNGVWSITVGPVVPDIYPYHFVVDGIGVADPINPDIFPNEGFKNSLVEIPGDSPGVADIKNIPHGTVARRYYHSDVLDVRSLLVYTPPGYEKSTTKNYPVLYLLHGSTDTEETWTKVGRANIIIDNLIEQGKAESMIIIMPYGRAYPKYGFDSGSLRDSANLFEFHKDFTENILPFVEGNYRIKKGPKSRAITGFSGGGGESLFIGLSHPELFAWVCGFAPGMRQVEFERNNAVPFADPQLTNERLELFWIGCGTDDGLYPVIQDYIKVLKEKNIEHETFFTAGGHTWMNCRLFLTEISQKLFK